MQEEDQKMAETVPDSLGLRHSNQTDAKSDGTLTREDRHVSLKYITQRKHSK